ncbi:hypothetical protein SKAU_G00154520 [Synaphobranchus kaupii]|uniref:Uncharacterized protein n=1 Tax=Synaphobranchus kaupii TaxID=118154 RepID=A0A9Q1FHA7_SYNKA|nr:hypothetical protein SKAU_G00154520 [Synaphobranchus kaupii]
MEKEGEGRYSLRLFSAYPADTGVYRCAVGVYAGHPNPGPSAPATVTRRSEGVSVRLKTKEVSVSTVAELPRRPQLKRGSTVSMLCNVSVTTVMDPPGGDPMADEEGGSQRGGAKGEEVEPEGGGMRPLAALTYDGLSRLYGNGSEVSMDKLAAGCYRLRIHAARPEDQGPLHLPGRGVGPGPPWRLVQHRCQCGVQQRARLPVRPRNGSPPRSAGGGRVLCPFGGRGHRRHGDLLLHEPIGQAAFSEVGRWRRTWRDMLLHPNSD